MASIRIKGFLIDRVFAARGAVPHWAFDGIFLTGLVLAGAWLHARAAPLSGALLVPLAAVSAAFALAVLGLFITALIRFGTRGDQVSLSPSTVVDFRRYLAFGGALVVLAAVLKPLLGL